MKTNRRKRGTQTSSFGSPGRANHNSTPFYKSKLYEGLPKEQKVKCVENLIPFHFLDKEINGVRSCNITKDMLYWPHDQTLRIEFAGAVYHLTSVGNTRQSIFLTEEDFADFLKVLCFMVKRYHFLLPAYCLISNHYHLFIEIPIEY